MSNIIKVSALGLSSIDINKNTADIYFVDKSVELIVSNGVNATIFETGKNLDVKINVLDSSVVNYFAVLTNESTRSFEINGEVIYKEISLSATKEKINANLNSVNSSFDAKLLSVCDGTKSSFSFDAVHHEKSTYSNIENVGVALNGGNLLFDVVGKIEKGKSKSKCAQISRGMVMDDSSAITANPILLIDEFDCFANHGASIGKVSDENLFYLMSRGLTKDEAVLLILNGIVKPYVDAVPLEEYKEILNGELKNLIEG